MFNSAGQGLWGILAKFSVLETMVEDWGATWFGLMVLWRLSRGGDGEVFLHSSKK